MNIIEVQYLASDLMRQHGLIQSGWRLEFDRSKRRFGVCRYSPKVISLSIPLCVINTIVEVKDVILHEIAHALVGHSHGHDYVWKRKCVEIGAKPERCYSSDEVNTPKMRYEANCGGCGKVHSRQKRITHEKKISCNCQSHLPWSSRILLTYVDTQNKFGR